MRLNKRNYFARKRKYRNEKQLLFISFCLFLLQACEGSSFKYIDLTNNNPKNTSQNDSSNPSPTPSASPILPSPTPLDNQLPDPTVSPTPSPGGLHLYKPEPLSWEFAAKENKSWSEYAFKVIDEEAFIDLDKAKDTENFCPNYSFLSKEQKINFWGGLFSAISKFESGYNPTSRMQETTMGIDSVTKKPVYSEGLLQLSYQDTKWASFCEFDWNKDKNLPPTDPRKTILNPYNNLHCGINIMARQIKKYGSIVLSSGVYWSVIKANGKYQKITEIEKITKQLAFCD